MKVYNLWRKLDTVWVFEDTFASVAAAMIRVEREINECVDIFWQVDVEDYTIQTQDEQWEIRPQTVYA